MNKYLLATFLALNAIPFFSITNPTTTKQPNKTQLLNHLKNVKVTLQKHLKNMHDNWQAGSMYSDEEDDDGELAEMTFGINLCEDFYQSSIFIQQKLSELVTPAFNFICNNIKPLTIHEITHHLHPYTKSRFDRDTTKQLQTLLQSLYNKHYQMHQNKNPHIKLIEISQTPIDELCEQCLWFILGTNSLYIYESRILLQKINAKIKELS